MFVLFCWWHSGVVSYNIILQNNPELVGVIMTDFHIKGTDSERLHNLAQVLPLVSGQNQELNLHLSETKAIHAAMD